jgi:hypothetical protein
MMRISVVLSSIVALCSSLTAAPTIAQDIDSARAIAVSILAKVEQRKNSDVWDNHVSNWFKQRMTREAFLANMALVQGQLGGAGTGRKLVQQNLSDRDPQSGYTGQIFSFMFATTFPAAKTYEMIVLIREDGAYRMSGLNFIPNPN